MKNLFTFFLVAFSLQVFTQDIDSTLFLSDFEFEVFKRQLTTGDADSIDLLVCMDGTEEDAKRIKLEIEKLEQELASKGVSRRSEKAKIKTIYKTVHSALLTQYNEEIYFSDIFTSGRYNCVTASALYAAILERFDIDYVIKEMPTHVYLIADPENTQIMIESTNPTQGVIVYDAKYRKQYVEYLVSNKLISTYDVSHGTVDEVFEKHHNEDTNIDLVQLAGLQYYNKGVFAYNSGFYQTASVNFEKARMLYPSNTINYMLNASLTNMLHSQYTIKQLSGQSIARYANLSSNNAEYREVALNYYSIAIEEFLITSPDLEKFEAFNEAFYIALNDTINKDPFLYAYYPTIGFYEYAQNNYSKSLAYFNLAYVNDTNNLRLKMAVQDMVGLVVMNNDNYPAMVDSLDYYFDVYPFLAENERLQRIYIYQHVKSLGEAAENEDLEQVDYYITKLEPFLAHIKTSIYKETMEQLYLAMASEYLNIGNSKKAVNYLDRGLALMPESKKLAERKKEIRSYTNYKYQAYVPVTPKLTPAEFSKKFSTNFPNCWQATKVRKDGKEESYSSKNKFTINASSYSKVTVGKDDKSQYGRWALRSKSKLLYLIPENDKENYFMFKIVDINSTQLELRLYQDKTCSKDVLIFTPCE